MYIVNGVDLDNPDNGWRLLRRTQIINDLVKRLTNVEIPGRHGILPGIAAFRGVSSATIVIRATGDSVEALYALFAQNGGVGYLALSAAPDRQALFELTSIDTQGIDAMDALTNVTISIRFPTADWRDTDETVINPATVTDPIATIEVFDNIGAEVADADIFIGGNFGNFELTDQGTGSWLKTILSWPYVAGTGLLYVSSSGRAFRSNVSAPWVPLTEMTNYVDQSGGGGFRISPAPVGGDPFTRRASLELVTSSQTSLTFGLRGRNAYLIRNGDVT